MVDLTKGNAVLRRHHEEFPNPIDAVGFHCVHDLLFLGDEVFHEVGESEPDFAVGVAVGLEEEWVARDGAGDLAAAWEP